MELLDRLPIGARRDLLRVLTSPSNVRADVIGQFHERGDDRMVEVLVELEADELVRFQAMDALRQSLDGPSDRKKNKAADKLAGFAREKSAQWKAYLESSARSSDA